MAKSKKDRSRKLCPWKSREELTHPSQNPHADSDWQFLCELELRVVDNVEQAVHGWLTECLKSLDLHEDFVNKLLRSAQGSVGRTVRGESGSRPEYIEFLLFVPPEHSSKGQSWGFFRVEKIVDAGQDAVAHVQTVAFYIYLEGP